MPRSKLTTDKPVIATGDHDRVAMFSVAKDGSLDQSAGVEVIGDKANALETTRAQFAAIAVSGVDAEKRAELGLAGADAGGDASDPNLDALRAAHDKAAASAEKVAERLVTDAHKG